MEWRGLSRRVVVIQNYTFDPGHLVSSVVWKISNETSNRTDYFEKLKGVESGTVDNNKFYGILPEQNGGLIRNEGFHFPMGLRTQHSETNATNNFSYVSYSYELTLKKPENITGSSYSVEIMDEYFKNNIVISQTGDLNSGTAKVSLSWKPDEMGNREYRVSRGGLKFIINYKSGDKQMSKVYLFDLYHTGFLYYDNSSDIHTVGQYKPGNGWYYYEVIPVKSGEKTRLWLDRNIGAKASGMYVQNDNGTNLFAQQEGIWPYLEESRGGMFSAADISNSGGIFTMEKSICPPGFRVPSVTEWQEMTGSDMFGYKNVYDFGKVYWDATYSLPYSEGNASAEKIVHFPKSRIIMAGESAFSGSDATAYFWTNTPAVGLTGNAGEAGKWVQCIKFERSSRSYGRYRIMADGGGKLGMSVRCVDEMEEKITLSRINFSVAGYTNIYVYTLDANNNRIELNQWPGDQIIPGGNWVTDEKYYDFTFETYANISGSVHVILTQYNDKGELVRYWNGTEHAGSPTHIYDIYGKDVKIPSDGGYIKLPESTTSQPENKITVKYRLWWQQDNRDYWKVYIYDGLNNNLLFKKDDKSNYLDGWYYFDFEIVDTPANIINRTILPKFQNNGGTLFYKKYNDGKIPIERDKWFKYNSSSGRYEYGKSDGELTQYEISQLY